MQFLLKGVYSLLNLKNINFKIFEFCIYVLCEAWKKRERREKIDDSGVCQEKQEILKRKGVFYVRVK